MELQRYEGVLRGQVKRDYCHYCDHRCVLVTVIMRMVSPSMVARSAVSRACAAMKSVHIQMAGKGAVRAAGKDPAQVSTARGRLPASVPTSRGLLSSALHNTAV
jgi:hypothetical protein